MLDIKLIREKTDYVKKGLKKKGFDSSILDKILEMDERWRNVLREIEELRHRQKSFGKDDVEKSKDLKNKIKEKEKILADLEPQINNLISELPNLPFDDVPLGKDERDNKVIREWGEKPKFSGFQPKDYLEIAENLDWIDVRRAAKVAGSRFGYLKKEAALLEFALVKLAFDVLLPEGFIPVIPPVMIKPEIYRGMGRLSESQKEERYYLMADNLYLVGSSEHTLGPMHYDEIFNENDLPRRYVRFSTCFRREAGSYGKDTKGILRVHQFDKVEMFSFTKPEDSESEHQFMVSLQEKIMQKIGLTYRVVEICTGDMGFTDARQYDIETWFPFQNKYRETHSCSNTTDFQARGINCRYRRESDKKTEFVHMLNGTAIALGRTIIAIIENYQQKDGSVKIPEILKFR